jgi:hypothetical protein
MSLVFESREEWSSNFEQGWYKHWQDTNGGFDWKIYQRPKNTTPVAGNAIDLSQSRLLFISSAGAYLPEQQEPFDAPHPLGDYSIRLVPSDVALERLDYAHDHYDQAAVRNDPQVLLPLRHLAQIMNEGKIDSLTPNFISYMGYQPDARRTEDELIPAILQAAQEMQAQAALLVPS